MINEILLSLNIISLIIVILLISLIIKNKKNEVNNLEPALNSFIFGLFFLLLIFLINSIIYFNTLYNFITQNYLYYVTITPELILIPLTVICFLVTILTVKNL